MTNQDSNDQFQTPMMIQYLEIKKQYSDCILFFRLGDFYEMFLEDAKIGAEVLDITLTARSRGKDGDIPMAGVPFHSVDSYLAKLVSAGYKVAICDQVSLPNGKGLVEREVIRVVTPGTNLNERGLEKKNNNYLLAIDYTNSTLVIVICDLGTGEIAFIEEAKLDLVRAKQTIGDLFSKIKPVEGIVKEDFYLNQDKMNLFANYPDFFVYNFEDWHKYTKKVKKNLEKVFKVQTFKSLNLENKTLVQQVTNVLLGYLQYTQKVDLKHIQPIKEFSAGQYLEMDRSTINNLELLQTLSGNKKNSLLDLIDLTKTAMGGRLLKKWLVKPLFNKEKIEQRLNITEELILARELREELVNSLKKITDIERTISRLSLNCGTPRDLISLKNSLQESLLIKQTLSNNKILSKLISSQTVIKKVIRLIEERIDDNPPVNPKNGGFIKVGVSTKLDQLRDITNKSRDWMDQFEQKEREKTGINSLKVKFNKVFGFYIEISKANLHLAPDYYDRKQTLVNAERFITKELKHHEQIVLEAEEQIFEIEYQLFLQTVAKLLNFIQEIQLLSRQIAKVDCLVSFALVSLEYNFSKPIISENNVVDIKDGRHPVIEKIIEKHNFVPNDTLLDQGNQQLIIITGPNMAGKSVLMRQTALIVLMSHMGSFVPASQATIGLTDKIFVRSGASDAITEGLSTFMVEMIETARILNNATKKSLVIMDEIGRGTSTYDGISIAWSVAERLVSHSSQTPKTLFATHYHELQDLEEKFPQKVSNFHMSIKNYQNEPVFLYLFSKGEASHSFGIQVAKLAGLPESVIQRSKLLMKEFDKKVPEVKIKEIEGKELVGKEMKRKEIESKEMNKKTDKNTNKSIQEANLLKKDLAKVNINNLTPLQALSELDKLIKKYGHN